MRRLPLVTHIVLLVGLLALAGAALAAAALLAAPGEVVATTALLFAAALAALLVWMARTLVPGIRHIGRAVEAAADGPVIASKRSSILEIDRVMGDLPALIETLRREQNALRECESRYGALAESLPAMVWVSEANGRVLFRNRRAAAYVGDLPPADTAAFHPEDVGSLLDKREAAARNRSEYSTEARVRRHDGAYRWHLITSSPVTMLVDGASKECWLGTAIDVEAQKEAEELQARLAVELERRVAEATRQLREETAVRQKAERQLRHTQKMEAISRLTGGIAHDLNNKLMVISANIDSVTKHVKDQPQLRRKLLSALVASDQAAALMSKLLAFARQRDLQAQYIDIGERLESITTLLDRSFLSDAVEVRLDVDDDLWPVEVDPNELETAIVNLGVNARDAMRDGGTIAIGAHNVRLRRGQLSDGDLSGDFVEIRISDTGAGIPPENLEHVFEPFFTTKEAGASGLGLSQVHGFARQLGGTVEIASTVGEGTTVSLFLPRADVQARIGARADLDDLLDDDDNTPGAADVLVVDDEVEVALALQSMLQESGYTVRMAVGADEALEALRAHAYQLVLTDVTMPGTMDGVTLAREVRKLHPDLPVVLITGNPMVVAGASEFPLLQKPITSRDLHAAIQRYLAPPEDDGPRVIPLFPRRSS